MMKNFFVCLILICLSLLSGEAMAQQATVNRQALFQKAYELLPVILESSLDRGFYNNELNGAEMRTFDKIRSVVLQDFAARRKDRLQFSSDQKIFAIDPNQPIRTAATSSDPRDPIYVNLAVINDQKNSFELEDAVQLLLHEYGHKIPDKVQEVVDKTAAKLRTFTGSLVYRTLTDKGDKLTILSISDLMGMFGLGDLLKSHDESQRIYLKTAMLFENSNAVSDLSAPWAQFLAKRSLFTPVSKDIIVGSSFVIRELTYEASNDSEIRFSMEIQMDAAASPTGKMVVGYSDEQEARQTGLDMKADVRISKDGTKMTVTQKRMLYPQDQLHAQIQSTRLKSPGVLEVVVKVATPVNFSKAQLIVESDVESLSITPVLVSQRKDLVTFEVKVPTTKEPKLLVVKSFVVDRLGLITLDKGFSFKSIQSNLAESYVKVRSMRVEESRLVMSVESPLDIQEIRLNQNSPLSVLNPENNAQVESIRSHYTVEHFDPKEFQQTRKGIMLDIIVPLNDRLSDEISERTSRVVARDEGARALLNIELVDSSLGHYAFPLGQNGMSYNISRRPGGMSCNHVLAN